MSLMERARSSTELIDTSDSVGQLISFETLRHRINDRIPATEVARLIAHNPRQARNELRLACDQVLKDEPWLVRSASEKGALIDQYLDGVFGLGPLEDMLDDESITEIMVNGTQSLYYEQDGVLYRASQPFASESQIYSMIDRIISPLGRRIDESSPTVNARLAQGHRVHAIIPPLAIDGPVVTIRKFRSHVFSLEEMREKGSFDQRVETLLKWAVLRKSNIAVSGGTGSGKTTLLNAISAVIPISERIVTIEDSAELRFTEHPHVVRLEARPRNAEGAGEVTIRDLVVNSLRMRPDRIIVGECRSGEALDMLQAMNTGHSGSLTTLHANSPEEAIMRLTTMVRYVSEIPVEVIETQIASAIDMVVQTARYPDGSRGISAIVGYSIGHGTKACVVEPYFERDHATGKQQWYSIPAWVDELPYLKIATHEEVETWKNSLSCSL